MIKKYKVLLWVCIILLCMELIFVNLDNIARKFIFQPTFFYKETPEIPVHYHLKTDYFISVVQDSIHIEKYSVLNPKGIIIYFHGNRSGLMRWGPIASEFTKYGYDVVCWDYRGFGKSTGDPSTINMLSDGNEVLNFVIKTDSSHNIILYGRSLGSGIACYLSGNPNVKKIILETPYHCLKDVINYHAPLLSPLINVNIPSFEYVKNVSKPFLILHGDKDKVVPLHSGNRLFTAIQNPEKKMITIKNGEHNNLYQFPVYWQSIEKFLNK